MNMRACIQAVTADDILAAVRAISIRMPTRWQLGPESANGAAAG